jgi:hypothetical protein
MPPQVAKALKEGKEAAQAAQPPGAGT